MTIAIDNSEDIALELHALNREITDLDNRISDTEERLREIDPDKEAYLAERAKYELNRIAHARMLIPVDRVAEHTVATGQYAGVLALQEYPEKLREQLNDLLVDKERAKRRMAELLEQKE